MDNSNPDFKGAEPRLQAVFALAFFAVLVGWSLKSGSAGTNESLVASLSQGGSLLAEEISARVLPEAGFQSRIVLGDAVLKLVQNGVIDKKNFLDLYSGRGGLPKEFENLLSKPSNRPIVLTQDNANYYLNFLWALGLSNYMAVNRESAVNGEYLFNLASTGGWTLGKAENGGEYFNKFKIAPLTKDEETLVRRIAENTFRPCCDNSTFFQDCNHGSALLGLLELGAAQGLTEAELYREALAFNSFWFPHNYLETALYFKAVKNLDWENVDPKIVMSKDYSSASGWYENVDKEIQRLGLVPKVEGGGSCGV